MNLTSATYFQGVFAFKRQSNKKHKNAPRLSTLDYWGQVVEGEEEEEQFKEITHKNYTRCWKIASNTLQVGDAQN